MSASLFLVGVGTGDPELLTLKAVRVLSEVKIIAYGQKPNTPSFSLEIAKLHLRKDVRFLPIDIPMKIEREPAKNAYDNLAKTMLRYLEQGKDVAYLCEGDPLFYASAMYLISRMKKDINIEIISGITSIAASSAAIKRPLCARNEIFKVLPAPLENEVILAELETAQAVAIIKVGRHFMRIKSLLEKSGHAENAMIIENASGVNERIISLNEYSKNELPYFASILCYKGDEKWGK